MGLGLFWLVGMIVVLAIGYRGFRYFVFAVCGALAAFVVYFEMYPFDTLHMGINRLEPMTAQEAAERAAITERILKETEHLSVNDAPIFKTKGDRLAIKPNPAH